MKRVEKRIGIDHAVAENRIPCVIKIKNQTHSQQSTLFRKNTEEPHGQFAIAGQVHHAVIP
jgi:hypothetical protein